VNETTVAVEIQREFRKLPSDTRPRIVSMDTEIWERFLWEIATNPDYVGTEIKRCWEEKCREYGKLGYTASQIKNIWCPEMEVCFLRNPYIQKIRITYSRR
jgi:hypothetical protein